MTQRASTTKNVWWMSSNYPASIQATDATGAESVSFAYGPDRQRVLQNYSNPSVYESTYYIGGLIDKVVIGSTIDYRHYIYAGMEPVAVYSRTAAGVNTMRYTLEDRQGGLSAIASSAGTIDGTTGINESFSTSGMRRNPTTWSGAPSTADLNTIAGFSRQGYTFQTALGQSMGLNHMNGRVEDAILGRFLSPDPHIPDPTNAQSYNRYSYVNNNPLTYIDPTGFSSVCATRDDGNIECKVTSEPTPRDAPPDLPDPILTPPPTIAGHLL
jgi:RHS repeat-associated protein